MHITYSCHFSLRVCNAVPVLHIDSTPHPPRRSPAGRPALLSVDVDAGQSGQWPPHPSRCSQVHGTRRGGSALLFSPHWRTAAGSSVAAGGSWVSHPPLQAPMIGGSLHTPEPRKRTPRRAGRYAQRAADPEALVVHRPVLGSAPWFSSRRGSGCGTASPTATGGSRRC
jgi:hypothetical protein